MLEAPNKNDTEKEKAQSKLKKIGNKRAKEEETE